MTIKFDADERGFFGESWGGRFMPEALVAALDELTEAWQAAMADAEFVASFEKICREYAGTPTGEYHGVPQDVPAAVRGFVESAIEKKAGVD